MKKWNLHQVSHFLLIAGILFWLSGFFLDNWIRHWFFPSSWGSVVVFYILPPIGLVTLILSFFTKKVWQAALSIAFILSFFITMFVGYFLFGP